MVAELTMGLASSVNPPDHSSPTTISTTLPQLGCRIPQKDPRPPNVRLVTARLAAADASPTVNDWLP